MNANYLYNVEYSEKAVDSADMMGFNRAFLGRLNEAVCSGIDSEKDLRKWTASGISKIIMKSSYPGVLIGTGSAHETGATGELRLGFTFDFVTGVPYLPGSSLKGVLRSAFHFGEKDDTEYICSILDGKSADFVRNLENTIFGEPRDKKSPSNGDNTVQSRKVIFLDSFITGMTPRAPKPGEYMGIDFITPHRGDALLEPNPIAMIRINPEVVFSFDFIIEDKIQVGKNGESISRDDILKLFTAILEDFGIGAKTNVGYGVLEEYKGQVLQHKTSEAPAAIDNDTKPRRDASDKARNRCVRCGEPVEINHKTGRPYKLCKKCNNEAPICAAAGCSTRVKWNERTEAWRKFCFDHKDNH